LNYSRKGQQNNDNRKINRIQGKNKLIGLRNVIEYLYDMAYKLKLRLFLKEEGVIVE